MPRFGPDPHAFFDTVYSAPAPWDIGDAQPALVELLAAHPPSEPVLDVGCGPGDLALWLARRGHTVLGVDFVESATAEARRRAESLPEEARARVAFEVGDALHPAAFGEFGAVVDSGFFHLFDTDERDRFVDELSRALRPGGRYYLLAFAVTFPIDNAPLAVEPAELQERFTIDRGWRVVECRSAQFHSRVGVVPATCALIERVPPTRS